jgi:hypothetical protein
MVTNGTIPPPTPLARRFVRSVLGFGVGIGLGLAPFLGKVVGIDALLNLYPEEMHASLIPLSAFLMGIVAAAVQYYAGEGISRTHLRLWFRRSLIGLLCGFFLFIILYTALVEQVSSRNTPLVIPWSDRLATCGCPPTLSNLQCIKQITIAPEALASCWGSGPLKWSRLLLSVSYLLVIGGFGALIGLLLLREEGREKRKPRSTGRRKPAPRPAATRKTGPSA